MPIMSGTPALPIFHGMTDDEAWEYCMDFEDWVYSNVDSYSERGWGNAVTQICVYFDAYYRKYR